MKEAALLILILCLARFGGAQDPEFSQYYAAPLNLNPAFAGTAADHRFIVNYRNQWPSIANGFITTAFSYDYNLHGLKSGIGLLLVNDRAGSAGLSSTTANFQYAYKVTVRDQWVLSSGLNFGIGNRSIDFSKLVFGDQLAFDADGNAPTDDPIVSDLQGSTYFDFGAGMLAYSKRFWLGFSAAHLNRPNRSLINSEAMIPVKTTFHGGVRLSLYHGVFKKDRTAALMPSFVYKRQGNFDQLDLGTYLLYEPIVFGLWYRGIPIQQNVLDNVSQDAVVVIFGFQFEQFEATYSYDVTVSELASVSGGAHELALKYRLNLHLNKPKKRQRYIPCPTFVKD